jgi:hypothetical protein
MLGVQPGGVSIKYQPKGEVEEVWMGVVPSGFLITGQCGATYQLPAQHLRPASEGWLNNLALLPGDQASHQACGPQEGCDHIYCAVGRAAAGKACFAFTV